MNKKNLFVILFLSLMLLFGLNSCLKMEADRHNESYVNIVLGAQPSTLDPSTGGDSYGNTILLNILEPLVRINEDEAANSFISAAGAESWDISEDELTYTFHLRDNRWNDGKAVTSYDYAFAIRRNAKPETKCTTANFLFNLKNGRDVVNGKKPVEELGVATPDEKTLVLTLSNPLPYFLNLCCQRTYFPQREDLVEKFGEKYSTSPETTPQCGPFILTDWVKHSQINFAKNENYWNDVNVVLDTVNCKIIEDQDSRYNSLLAGTLDFASVSEPEWRKKFENNSDFVHSVIYDSDTAFIFFNVSEGRLTANKKIRQALSVSVDRQDFIDACKNGVGLPAFSFVPVSVFCQDKQFTYEGKGPVKELIEETPDPRALFIEGLRELGIDKDPEEITLEYMLSSTGREARIEADYIQKKFKEKLGINIKISMQELEPFFKLVEAKDYDLAVLVWGAYFNDPSTCLEVPWTSSAILDTGWINEDYNECMEKAQAEIDAEKRYQLLKRADEILCKEEAAYLPLTTNVSYVFNRKFIKNVPVTPFNTMGWQVVDTQDRP